MGGNKYENSYKYIEEYFYLYPVHQLDKEHLGNIKELINKVKQLEEKNFDLRLALNVEEECYVMLETEYKKLKATIKILITVIGFDFLEASNGTKAMEVLNGACLLTDEQYQLLKEVLNE